MDNKAGTHNRYCRCLPEYVLHCITVCQFAFIVIIPNAEEIAAARRQRRATRAQKEFIPLGRDGSSSAGGTLDHYSRSDEDDRDDDELDDHELVIQFAPRLKSVRERIANKLGKGGKWKGECMYVYFIY